jgi:hypothetical protein
MANHTHGDSRFDHDSQDHADSEDGAAAPLDEREEMSTGSYLLGYVAVMGGTLGIVLLAQSLLGIDPLRTTLLACGVLFAWAALGKPRALYLVVRSLGWFHLIRSPDAMRAVLVLLAVLLLVVGVFAPA